MSSRAGRMCWLALLLAACSGEQSALDPAGEAATHISRLFWLMCGAGGAIWIAMVALTVFATYREPSDRSASHGRFLIIGGGVIFPTLLLTLLLAYGLSMLPPLLAAAPPGSLQIRVTGEQYFWRVRYTQPDGHQVELANELRLAVGQPVQLILDARDVIHSFWVPALAGKVDMIPGRRTQLQLLPTRTGVFRGTCAEYCGTSHALMSLHVVVLEPDELQRWLREQAQPARRPLEPEAVRGAELFTQNGCGACHSVRGTHAQGVVGPELTHVGSRLSLGAGTLSNEPAQFARFLAELDQIKPGTSMPHFGMLARTDLSALGAYLEALQ